VGSPTGGPEDKTPPHVVAASPSDSAVAVDRRTPVRIEFSKRMQKESVERALFISPYPDPYPRLDWSRADRLLTLTFDEPLDSNRTYVITVGTDARDAHGNRIASSSSFAFATGLHMNSGRIVGSVYDVALRPAVGAIVGIYAVTGTGDEPNPSETYPLYTSQVGEDGGFSFGYLGAGTYRIFAWKDREADEHLGPDEEVAVPVRDVILEEDGTASLPRMRLVASDRRPPELVLVRAVDRSHLELRFDEEVVTESLTVAIPAPDTLAVTVIPDLKPARTVMVRTSDMKPGRSYGIDLTAMDPAANRAHWAADTTFFDSAGLPDTTGPKVLAVELPDLILNDTLASLKLWFDDVLGAVALDSVTVLRDTVRVGGAWRQQGANRLVFRPAEALPPGRSQWRIPLDHVKDASGNRGRDTASVSLTCAPADSLGELTGTVIDTTEVRGDGRGIVTVEAHLLQGDWRVWASVPQSAGAGMADWHMEAVPAGGYTLFAWRDRDEDSVWSPGSAMPFQPAERWTVGDTIYVRARWTSAGVTISF